MDSGNTMGRGSKTAGRADRSESVLSSGSESSAYSSSTILSYYYTIATPMGLISYLILITIDIAITTLGYQNLISTWSPQEAYPEQLSTTIAAAGNRL